MPDSAARTDSAKSFAAPAYRLGDFAPVISLGLIVLVFSLIVERFLSLGTLSLILQQSAVLAIVATGLTFVLLCAEIDLSVGMVALLSACLCGVLWEQSFAAGPKGAHAKDVSLLTTAMIITAPIIIAVFAGWLSGRLTVSSGLPSFIITLAMMNIALGLAKFMTKSEKFSMPTVLETTGNGAWKLYGDLRLPHSSVLAAIVMFVAHLALQHTRFGRYVYMTGGNRDAARLAGVRTDRIVVSALAICGLTAAIGGLVNAGRMRSVSLDQNADLLLDAVACVVLGGTSLFGGEGSSGIL